MSHMECRTYPCASVKDSQNVEIQNGGKAKKLELKDSLPIDGRAEPVTLENYFKAEYYREIGPLHRFCNLLGIEEVKEKKEIPASVTIGGKKFEVTKELIDHVFDQEQLYQDKSFSHKHRPPRAHSNSESSFERFNIQLHHFKKLSPVPEPLRTLLRQAALFLLFQQIKSQ